MAKITIPVSWCSDRNTAAAAAASARRRKAGSAQLCWLVRKLRVQASASSKVLCAMWAATTM